MDNCRRWVGRVFTCHLVPTGWNFHTCRAGDTFRHGRVRDSWQPSRDHSLPRSRDTLTGMTEGLLLQLEIVGIGFASFAELSNDQIPGHVTRKERGLEGDSTKPITRFGK